jgi:hypothetical protein
MFFSSSSVDSCVSLRENKVFLLQAARRCRAAKESAPVEHPGVDSQRTLIASYTYIRVVHTSDSEPRWQAYRVARSKFYRESQTIGHHLTDRLHGAQPV